MGTIDYSKTDRIKYDAWVNSPLSIARHYGGIKINGIEFRIEKSTGDLVRKGSKQKKK